MKVSYISDLHLDFHIPFHKNQDKFRHNTERFAHMLAKTDKGEKDVLVIAGDISHFNIQSKWFIETLATHYYNQILTVFGNHDYYLVSNNQSNKYKNNSSNRIKELESMLLSIPNVFPLHTVNQFNYNGVKFGGITMWYPLESFEQMALFNNKSNDSKLIKGFNIKEQYHEEQKIYNNLLKEDIDIMISHMPIVNIDTHFKYSSTACYLTPVDDIKVDHWIMAHSHEQKIYKKPYCTFYMNCIGYPDEKLDLSIKSFIYEEEID